MARGLPAIWSTLVAIPFFLMGGYFLVEPAPHPQTYAPFFGFGGFIFLFGLYVHFVAAPDPPRMRDGERVVETRTPSQRVPLVRVLAGVPFLVAGVYLMFGTGVPYVYPTAALAVGLWLFSTGIHQYWVNSLTSYIVTTERIIRVYRFLSLVQSDVPFEKVRAIEERRSFLENLAGLGNIRVASGAGGLSIEIRNIENPAEFADQVREFI